jgi:hypothetical protein
MVKEEQEDWLSVLLIFYINPRQILCDKRDAFRDPGITILFPAASLVLIVVLRKDRRNIYSVTIKCKCRQADG